MELTASEYRTLFSNLKEKLFQKEFKEAVKEGKPQKEIWHTLAMGEDGEWLAETFMSNRFRISPLLLTQKMTEANTKAKIPIKDFTFVRIIEYLDNIPPTSGYKGTEWKQHANSLKEKFLVDYNLMNSISGDDVLPQYISTCSLPGIDIVIHVEFKKR